MQLLLGLKNIDLKKVSSREYRKIYQTGKLKLEIDKLRVFTMIKIFQQQKFSFIE